MAIHDSVLLGAMSQSVDNLTMCVCRKLRIVRHKAKHVTNPRTDKQRVQRAKMKAAIELAQAFAPIAKIGFPAMAAGQTGYNGFVSANLQAVTVDEGFVATVDYSKLACSSDLKLRTPKVTATLADKSITFTQESQEASSWANRDDQVYAVERARRERSDEFCVTGRLDGCRSVGVCFRHDGCGKENFENIGNKHGIGYE